LAPWLTVKRDFVPSEIGARADLGRDEVGQSRVWTKLV